jgi:dolichol-phosphate mannosyltransferase
MQTAPDAAGAPAASAGPTRPLLLSVVIPVRNEAPNIAPLVAEIERRAGRPAA